MNPCHVRIRDVGVANAPNARRTTAIIIRTAPQKAVSQLRPQSTVNPNSPKKHQKRQHLPKSHQPMRHRLHRSRHPWRHWAARAWQRDTHMRRTQKWSDVQSYRLEKRKPKKAKACDFDLTSFDYYSSSKLKAKNPKIYGFNDKHSCDNYDWGTPDATAKYESEHILEWQVVGGFFNKMGEDIKDDFDDPDPRKTGKVKFCEYWLESWRFRNKQLIDDPLLATPAPSSSSSVIPSSGSSHSPLQTPTVGLLPSNGSKSTSGSSSVVVQPPQGSSVGGGSLQRTPFHWLASQYPSKKMWVEEMPLLEKALNGENKEKVRKYFGAPHKANPGLTIDNVCSCSFRRRGKMESTIIYAKRK
jgi:hypothetical protein